MSQEYLNISERLKRTAPEYTEGADQVSALVRRLEAVGRLPKNIPVSVRKPVELTEFVIEEDEVFFTALDYRQATEQNVLTPEMVNIFWQTAWRVWGEKIGEKIVIPELDISKLKLRLLESTAVPPYFIPNISVVHLETIFPHFRNNILLGPSSLVKNKGWRSGEASLIAPHLNDPEQTLRKNFQERGRDGMDIREYIILSQFTRLTRGYFLDQGNTWSRLLGSMKDQHAVIVKMNPNGTFSTDANFSLRYPGDNDPHIGGRSSVAI